MTKQINQAGAAMKNALAALGVISPLLSLVREDMVRRIGMPNRKTSQLEVSVETETGICQPYLTVEIDPETGFATMIDTHMVSPDDVTMAEGALAQAQVQLQRALAMLATIPAEEAQ